MYRDVIDLHEFYKSNAGRVARRVIRQRLRQFWPDLTGQRVLGMGYAVPYLDLYGEEAERTVAVMPPGQGALNWPEEDHCLVAMAHDDELPFDTESIDRIILVHSLEFTGELRAALKEIWRVLAGNGRLLVVAPNRSGIWARVDSTPFGLGSPCSINQIRYALRDSRFVVEQSDRALYVPPVQSRVILSTTRAWERIGNRFFNTFGGVNLVEASKQLYSATPLAVGEKAGRRRIALATETEN